MSPVISKKLKWIALPLLAGAMRLPTSTFAQQHGDGPPPPSDAQGPGGGGPGRPGREGPPDGQGRPDRPDRQGGPNRPMPPEMQQLERMRGYLDLVDRFSRLSRDPSAAGVAAVITASDILKPRGSDAAIEFFNKTLPNVKDPAIQRAIRLQLIDLYKTSGQQDKAMEQLTQLMTASASTGETSPGSMK